MKQKIAILLPCYNEEKSVSQVIYAFKKELPEADIFLYNNNSTDNSAAIAKQSGAIVRYQFSKGKGNVIRSMFKEIEADIYVMVDVDNTYPADAVHQMIKIMNDTNADMVTGNRLAKDDYKLSNKRRFHYFGNNLVRSLINQLFNTNLKDIMTGYRVFNRYFVKNIPIMSTGFEVETEMTLHALDKRFRIVEIPINYKHRIYNNESKLNTFSDGFKILATIFLLFKDYKPLKFFTFLALFLFSLSIAIATPVIIDFFNTGLVQRLPTAILSLGVMILSVFSMFVGFILDTVAKQHRFNYELNLKNQGHCSWQKDKNESKPS